MADVKHPLYPDVTIDSTSGVADSSGDNWTYTATKGGSTFQLPAVQVRPNELTSKSGQQTLAVVLDGAGPEVAPEGEGSTFIETVIPAAQKGMVANVAGAPVDLMNMLVQAGVDSPVNFTKWAMSGFQGDMPTDRVLSSDDPFLGSKSFVRGFEAVGQEARELREAAEQEGPLASIPAQALRFIEFDMTPDESTKARKYISLITQVAAGAPVEGKAIADLAIQLAKNPSITPTTEAVYNAISEMQRTNPAKAAAFEGTVGTLVGTGMVGSLEILESTYPNAPQWMKNTVMAGGSILLPIGTITASKTAWDVASKAPIVSIPSRLLKGAALKLSPSGADRAAAQALQTYGADWRDKQGILGVTQQLRLALAEGRDMDPNTRISYTTPQLARAEAQNLEAQLTAAINSDTPPTSSVVESQRDLIEKLRTFANFQEGQLKTVAEGSKIGAEAYARYSERMIDRSNSIFGAMDDLYKLNVGGIKYEGGEGKLSLEADYSIGRETGEYLYTENILRGIASGEIKGVSPEALKSVQEAVDKINLRVEAARDEALADAQARVEGWRNLMPEDMSPQQRADFDFAIRREIETAYKELDTYEDVLWNNIDNWNVPKTESFTAADGQDLGPQLLVDGVPIGEHFAAKAAATREQAGESENQSKWLWKLAGRAALTEQAAKSPDGEKVARQENRVADLRRRFDTQDAIVAREKEKLDEVANQGNQKELDRIDAEVNRLYDERGRLYGERSRTEDDFETRQDLADRGLEDPFLPQTGTQRPSLDSDLAYIDRQLGELNRERAQLVATAEGDRLQGIRPENLSEKDAKAYNAQDRIYLRALDKLNDARNRLAQEQGDLDITMGAKVTSEGAEVKLLDEIDDTSALGVKTVDGVTVGRSPQEVHNIVSHLKRELAFEVGSGSAKNAKKVRAISDLISDLQRVISDPENFELNLSQRESAVRATALKKGIFEKGSIGELRGFTRTGEARVPIEQTADRIIRGFKDRGKQDVALRELENALTPITTGENTPVRKVVNEEGVSVTEFNPDFNLQRYAEAPPPPFERITVGDSGRSFGFRVAEGTPATPAAIEIVRNTLWDRFSKFGTGDEFSSSAAERWINNNKPAIQWLEKATGKATGFEDLTNAETVARYIRTAKADNLDKTIEGLRSANAFDDVFTESGFRLLIEEAAKRDSNVVSASTLLDNPDPLTLGETFLRSYESPTGKPTELLNSTLKVLDNGTLPDGSNPALEGFKQAIAEALIKRSLTRSEGSSAPGSSPAAQEAQRLSASLRKDVTLWDPDKMIGLSQSPQISRLLSSLYGEDAATAFRRIAEGAQDQFAISKAAQQGVELQDKTSSDWAGNLGRVAGGLTAKATGQVVSGLILAGVGRRTALKISDALRGVAIEKNIVDLLMNPKLAAEAIERYPVAAGEPQSQTGVANFFKRNAERIKLYAHENFITKNGQRLRRLGQTPGVLYEIGEPTKYEELEGPVIGPVTEVAPEPRPTRQLAQSMMPTPNPASALNNVNIAAPISPPQQPSAASQASPQTLARLEQVGLPLFANKGGIMSVRPKPRQMVG